MEEDLNRLTGAIKEFKRQMFEGVHLYEELLKLVQEQNTADMNSFLSNVPGMTQDEIIRNAAILSGKKEGREYIFDLIESVKED